jgi:hypothetical protein
MTTIIEDYCPTIEPIPQFQGTCWFNAILTCMLYSQGLSNLIREKAIKEQWIHSDDVFKVVLNRILTYIDNIRKTKDITKRQELNKRLNKYLTDVKPELILLKFAYDKDDNLYQILLNKRINTDITNFGKLYSYIIIMCNLLNIPFMIKWLNDFK